MNRLENEKKKNYLVTVAHVVCGIPQTHQSMLIQVKLSEATLKLGMAGINWMFILNRKNSLHGLTTHLLQDTIPHFFPYFHMPSYRPPLFAFSQKGTAGQEK